MNLSYLWLKELLDLPAGVGPERVAELLTLHVCPTEGLERLPDGDVRIALEVTFNRPDLLSHMGVAREIGCLLGRELREPAAAPRESAACPVARCATVEVEAKDLCPRYTARVVRNVRTGPSPEWLARRVEAVGLRSVNNVVDVTNLVLFEVGQPLHAFDLALLHGQKIVVRRARAGETITAIDGTVLELDPETLVIADGRRPVAVAGIMGGIDTEISDRTRDVLIESAYFDPVATRRAVRRLGLRSESSHRFERGVDPARVDWASRRAAHLIQEVAGGDVCEGALDFDAGTLPGPKRVTLRLARLRHVAGVDIPRRQAARLLHGLGMEVIETETTLEVTVPTARAEVAREIDLIEEVIRTFGYDKVPLDSRIPIRVAPPAPRERAIARARDVLVGAGYREIDSVSFVERDDTIDPPLFTSAPPLAVRNPVRRETPVLRRSLFGPLLRAKKTNMDKGTRRVRLFEMSVAYLGRPGNQPDERLQLGVLADAPFLDVKGAIEAVAEALGLGDALAFEGSEVAALDSLEQAAIRVSAAPEAARPLAGYMGKISEAAAEKFDLGRDRPVVALLDFDLLLDRARLDRRFREISPFPGIARDLAAIVDADRYWADILHAARSARVEHLREIRLLSVFEGDGKAVPKGKKSVAFRMEFRAPDRTLTSEQADGGREAVKAALRERFAAEFRE
jgi:phenylalanyl-tRNA synthetase beta chain